jgi:hypothetical protein
MKHYTKQLIDQTLQVECLLAFQIGRFKYQTKTLVIPILFIFNLFLLNRLSIKIIYYVCKRQYEIIIKNRKDGEGRKTTRRN